jgi:hypothetical protein
MKAVDRDKARLLRIKYQLSYSSILKQVRVSRSTLTRWLKDLPLTEERILELRRKGWSKGEAQRERIRETKRKKRAESERNLYEKIRAKFPELSHQTLFVAGLMLYQAEGDKKDPYHIGLANTDPQVIKFFIWWVQEFLKVEKSRIRIQLHLYDSMNTQVERKFWAQQTGLPYSQFYKDQIREIRPKSFSYSESFRHGTCKIYINGLKETQELMLSIRAFFDKHNELHL